MDENISGIILLCFIGYVKWSWFYRICKSCVQRNVKINELLLSIRRDGAHYKYEKIRRCTHRLNILRKAIVCLPLESPEAIMLKEEQSLWRNYRLKVDRSFEDFEHKCCKIEEQLNLPLAIEDLPKLVEIEEPVTWMNLDRLIPKYHSKDTLYKVCWENEIFKPINLLGKLISNLKKKLPSIPERRLRTCVAYIYNKHKRGIFKNELKQMESLSCKMLRNPNSVFYEEDEEGICTICQSEIRVEFLTTRCNHRFHPLCIQLWTEVDAYCPLCSTKLKAN